MRKNFLLIAAILFMLLAFYTGKAEGSEGTVELENTDGSKGRCFAMSTLPNRSSNYQLLIQCRDLIYPIEPNGQYYILWADTIGDQQKIIRIGELGFGKSTFKVREPFYDLFVTKEQTRSPRQPAGERVMEGQIVPITFLDKDIKPTTKPTPKTSITPKVSPTPAQQGRGGTSFIITIIIIIVIMIIFGVVFFIINRVRKAIT